MAEESKESTLKPTILIRTDGINKEGTDDFQLEVNAVGEEPLMREDVIMLLIYAAVDAADIPDDEYYATIDRVVRAIFPHGETIEDSGEDGTPAGADIPY